MSATSAKRGLLALLLSLLLLMLPGCWDRTEINDIAIVLGSSLDLEDDGLVRYAVQMPLPSSLGGPGGGGGGTSGNKSSYIDSEVGQTAREAAIKLQQRMSRRFFVAHRRVMVVGEELAKKQGLRELFDMLPRLPESRMTSFIIIAKGKGYDLLNAQPRFERFSSEAIRELAKAPGALSIKVKDVAVSLSDIGSDPIIPIMGVKDNQKGKNPSKEIETIGLALFQEDKMVGVANETEMHGIGWLRNQVKIYGDTIKLDNGSNLTFMVREGSSRMKCRLEDEKIKCSVDVRGSAVIQENGAIMDLEKLGATDEAEKKMNEHVQASIQKVAERIRKQKIDVISLGNNLWRTYPNLWDTKLKSDWGHYLETVEFDVKVDMHFSNYGLIFENVSKEERI